MNEMNKANLFFYSFLISIALVSCYNGQKQTQKESKSETTTIKQLNN